MNYILENDNMDNNSNNNYCCNYEMDFFDFIVWVLVEIVVMMNIRMNVMMIFRRNDCMLFFVGNVVFL